MKNTFKRLIAVSCAIIVLLSCSTTAFAQNLNTNTQEYISNIDIDENYFQTSCDEGYEENLHTVVGSEDSSISIDEIISKSTNIQRSSNSCSGSFKSDKYNAGILGYKYQIKFDWVAKVSNGDYVFDKITNYTLTTYTNYLLLALTWESYTYKVTKNTYSFSGDRLSVNCFANYIFDVRDKTTHNDTMIIQDNKKVFYLDDLL